MSSKKISAKKGSPARTSESDQLDEMRARLLALYAVLPTERASATIREYCQDYGNLDLKTFSNALREQISAINKSSLQTAGNMLAAQAHTLDAIFNNLARSAVNAEYVDQLERYLALALRAQSQCRTTWAAVAAIQNPPVMGYVKQANIAHGPQQVNNTVAATQNSPQRRDDQNRPNKLLEETDGERLDSGATGSPSRADPEMATVGEIDGAENN